MTPEQINNRLLQLTQAEQQCQKDILQKQADLNAIQGAKQDCNFWLAQFQDKASDKAMDTPTQNATPIKRRTRKEVSNVNVA